MMGKERRGSEQQGLVVWGRSYSVGFGRIERIDNDKPCEFEEEEDHHIQANGNIRDPLLYPRSKTYVVRRNLVYHWEKLSTIIFAHLIR